MAEGPPLVVESLGRADAEPLMQLFARLSPESRRQRFLGPKPRLTAADLRSLTSIDHVQHEAIAAVDPRDHAIVAIARYARVPDRPGVAEIAAEVADGMHNMGIATALAMLLIERARTSGFTSLTATVLWDNRPARAVLRQLGFRARRSAGATIELERKL